MSRPDEEMLGKIAIDVTCPVCGEHDVVFLNEGEYASYCKWLDGEMLIQEALPNKTPDEREQLKTGICSHCWDMMFGGDDADDCD